MRDGYARNDLEQEPQDVSEVATEYFNAKLKTVDEVVRASVYMVATQLAKEPLVRQTIRDVFQEKATLSSKPTQKGVKEIGEDHELFTMKYLKDKPIKEIKDEEFLKLQAAADAKLVELTVADDIGCLLYTSPSPRDGLLSRMPSSA